MARVPNPRKKFHFVLEIAGVNQFLAQKVTMPEVEIEATAHGDTNHDVKTAGRVKVSDMKIEKLIPAPGGDTWAMEWLKRAQNMATGTGNLSPGYKQLVIVKETDPMGITLNRWVCYGVWVRKCVPSEYDRNSSDNMMETVELSVDEVERV